MEGGRVGGGRDGVVRLIAQSASFVFDSRDNGLEKEGKQ